MLAVRAGDHPGGGRAQREQRVHGVGGPAAGTGLGRAPAGHDGDDERRDGEMQPHCERAATTDVDMAAANGDDLHGLHRERGHRAQGDQGVHVHRAPAQQAGCVAQERPATGELGQQAEGQDGPARPRGLGQGDRHEQRGERQRPGDESTQRPVVAAAALTGRHRGGHRLGGVPGVGDGPPQLTVADHRVVVGDERPGRGQVDRCAGYRGQAAQRSLDPHRAGAAVHAANLKLGGGQRHRTGVRLGHRPGSPRR